LLAAVVEEAVETILITMALMELVVRQYVHFLLQLLALLLPMLSERRAVAEHRVTVEVLAEQQL
jgi:hypothetical protein